MSIDIDKLHDRFTYQRRYEIATNGGRPSQAVADCNDILALIVEVRALRGAVALTEDEREALLFARVLLGVNPLGFHSHDPVVIEHDKKCGAALALLDKLGGAR